MRLKEHPYYKFSSSLAKPNMHLRETSQSQRDKIKQFSKRPRPSIPCPRCGKGLKGEGPMAMHLKSCSGRIPHA